jgi:hypothetical protein
MNDDDRERCVELFRQWIGRMFAGSKCAVSGLLLTLTPNLKKLDITIFDDCWAWTTVHHPLSSLYGLSDIRDLQEADIMAEVALLSPMMRGVRTVKSLRTAGTNLSILSLPFENLKHLIIDLQQFNGHDSWNEMIYRGIYRHYPALESLGIVGDWEGLCENRSGSDIQGLLRNLRCADLKSFSLKLDECGMSYGIPHIGSVRGLLLEYLRIDFVWSFGNCPFKSFEAVTTLKHFRFLKKLEVPQAVLLPRGYPNRNVEATEYPVPLLEIEHRLPSTLEELVIHSPDKNMLLLLERIVQKRSEFPRLRTITLSCNWDWGIYANFFRRPQPVILSLRMHGIDIRINYVEMPSGWGNTYARIRAAPVIGTVVIGAH